MVLYTLHYAFPLLQHWRGYELELLVWDALWSRRLAPETATTVWALRWLVQILLRGLAWLRLPAVYTWVYTRVDGDFLHQLLVGVVGFVLCYLFVAAELGRWQWGLLYWALCTVLAVVVHIKVPVPLVGAPSRGPEAHFVPLEED